MSKYFPLDFKNQATIKVPGLIFNNVNYLVEQAHSVVMSAGGSWALS